MNILGYSGLHDSVTLKAKLFPGLDPRAYRIAQGFDSAAALIVDNQVIAAAAEERFTKQKTTGQFPINAINYCLQTANLRWQDIDYVAHGFDYDGCYAARGLLTNRSQHLYAGFNPALNTRFVECYSHNAQINHIRAFIDAEFPAEKFAPVPHHLAHAASAYYLSGFDKSLIMIADGAGEIDSLTIAIGDGERIDILKQIPEMHSLGLLYGVFTYYLGFEFNADEYKVMGLAPYGDPMRYMSHIDAMIQYKADGTFIIPILNLNSTPKAKETFATTLAELERIFGPARKPGATITQEHKDIAAALQLVLQQTLMQILLYWKNHTLADNLCLVGGVALNCSANGYIKSRNIFKQLFIQPAAGDDGTALGAALYVAKQYQPQQKFAKLTMPCWGPSYDDQAIGKLLPEYSEYQVTHFNDFNALAKTAVELIANGQVVGCFQGRMEMGPRALGNRSILADPRSPIMRDKINSLVKKREDFRPFAPAVIAEKAAEYFAITPGDEASYTHMLITTQVKDEYKQQLPAITHVNGSARIETVIKEQCPMFWELINEFGKLTGIAVLLNTSFNVRGQPIVCTPEDALATFKLANLDALIIGNYLLIKQG